LRDGHCELCFRRKDCRRSWPQFPDGKFISFVPMRSSWGRGCVRLYEICSNAMSQRATGMAWPFAGATLIDMEMVQFHPTRWSIRRVPRNPRSEAVRGDGDS
jgi:hypothetical protein